jgi:tetratricopeptide (TPR) repeat protein
MIGTTLLTRYRLDAELGRGGTGVVYRAFDTLLERTAAVKVLSTGSLDTEGRVRLLNEARAAAQLKHPHIVSIYDAGEIDDMAFIIMELLEGASLFDVRPENLFATLGVISQVCDALAHAHSHGVIHRDLKLENVIVSPAGHATLTDFGLACSTTSRVTTEGGIVGTVFYLPPEQILGQRVDGRADLYALGVMLYELTAGRLPFTGDDPLAVISQHLYAPVVPPSTYQPGLPPTLDRLIVQLMSKEAQDRPASAEQVRQTLEAILVRPASGPDPGSEDPSSAEDAAVDESPLERLARGRLVGRACEMAEARAQWQRVAAGKPAPPVLLISGDPGVGKTPLVHEIMALAQVAGGRALASVCYAEDNVPYGPIVQLARAALPYLDDEAGFAALADLAGLAPDLAERFGAVSAGVASMAAPEPQVQQQRLFESVVSLAVALARRGPSGAATQPDIPLLFVIEDLQWADPPSLFLLRHLARRSRPAGLRLLVVLTYREAQPDASCCLEDVLLDFQREQLAAQIKLLPYDRAGTAELLQSLFQQEPEPAFVDAIYRVTEGNLFYIEEICKTLIEAGQLHRVDGHWHWPDMTEHQLPPSIRATILARVAKLPEAVQDVLRLAAIIGREFDFATLLRAGEQPGGSLPDEDALIDALEQAERAQLIQESGDPDTFVFAHALIPHTLAESISGLRRRRMHRRVLAALQALGSQDYATLAEHAAQAGDNGQAQAYLARAGERALAVFSNQEAELYLRRALDLTPSGPAQAPLLAQLGEALFRQARYAEAGRTWQSGLDLYRAAGDAGQTARLYARAARAAHYWSGAVHSLAVCRQGLAAIEDVAGCAPETPGMAALLHETARAYRFNGLAAAALPYCEQALALARRLNLVEIQAESLATLGILDSEPAAVRQQALTQAVALAESAGLFFTAVRAHDNMSDFLRDLGDLRGMLNHNQRARELAQRVGMAPWEYFYTFRVAESSLELGAFPAVAAACAALRHMEGHAALAPVRQPVWREYLEAMVARCQGRLVEVAETLARLHAAFPENPGASLRARLEFNLGDVLLEQGRLDDAEQVLLRALDIQDLDLPVPRVTPYCLLAVVYAAQGRLAEAGRLFDQADEIAAPHYVAGDAVLMVWAEARLAAAAGEYARAAVAYADAAARLSASGAAWRHARLLLEWAGLRVHAALPPAPTRDLLTQAQSAFTDLSCPYYAAEAAARLSALHPAGL